MLKLRVGDRCVGVGEPCFVIAEAGVNHNGSLEAALRLVDAAKDAGADAIKFQSFRTDALVMAGAPKAKYQIANTGSAEAQDAMLRKIELSATAHKSISAHCTTRGIMFLSSAFDECSADLLQELEIPAFKLGSGEITNTGLLGYVARYGRPVILSTGMCSLAEVEAGVEAVEAAGNSQIVLLHCVSEYPADPRNVNLRAMGTLKAAFQLPVGYSDHTIGNEVALAAVALGACVIEKHVTLDRTLPGPDHRVSCEPTELRQLVAAIRNIEAALGDGRKRPARFEGETAVVVRKSLVAAVSIPAGTTITNAMLAARRPGTGLPANFRSHVAGKTARRTVEAGELIELNMLE